MDAAVKVAKQRLNVLELAKTLGNVSEACVLAPYPSGFVSR